MSRHQGTAQRVRAAALDAWAVLMPTECSGCGRPDRALCETCLSRLQPNPRAVHREDLTIWAALDYADAVARVLVAYKDGGRTDAAAALAAALRDAVRAALTAELASTALTEPSARGAGVILVTVPSSRHAWRMRGFHPVNLLLDRAGLRARNLLRLRGTVVDQVGLGAQQRRDNRSGSLVARRPLAGGRFLLVDDIVTTGATLLEAARAIREAGGQVLGAATVAETRRRRPDSNRSPKPD